MPACTPRPSSSAPPQWSRRWRCRRSCPKAGGKMGKRNPRGKPLGFWQSIRDLNSGGTVNALSHFESHEPLANRCQWWSKQAGSSPIFRGGWPCFGLNAKISSMVRIVLQHPFCHGFARIFGKMQDGMQDKRKPTKPHGDWGGTGSPAGRPWKMRDLNLISRTNLQKHSVLYNLQPFSGDGSFTIPMLKRRTQSWQT